MQQNGANNSQPGVSNFTEASPASSSNNNATSPLPPPRKLTEASSSASITSARGVNQFSEVGSTLGTSKDYSSLAAFNSFLNNSVFPIEDLHNVAQAWKPPEKNNIPVSSNQKGSSVFSRFTKRVNVRFKGKTFLEMPSYPFVNSDNEAEPISSKSPTNAGTRSKPSSASGKRPNSSSKKTQQPNNNTTTSSNTSQLEDENVPKLWEHRFVYFLVSNYQGNTGQTEMHHTLIESQDFLIEKEHCIVFETLQDLVYYESSPFISFLIRREFDPSLPASSVAEKKKNGQTNTQKKDAAASNSTASTLAKKDNAPPPPGLPTPSTTKKIQTAISAATSINQDELIESMVHDIKSSFGSNCEILHTFKTCTMPLFVNDKFGFTKAKYEQKQSIKYKNWSSLLCKSDNTLNIAAPTLLMDDSFKSETPSSSRFSITQLPNTNETSEILNHINVRIEVAEGTSILSEEVQNKLNPVLISVSSLKDLPNEKYLAERCKPVSLSFNIRGKTFRTNGYEHASFISLNYKRIIYLGSNSEMEMYREYFSRMPIVFEVHDRDPKEGVGKFFGKAEVSLKTMILNSRGREVSDNFQIQGVCMLQDEYEKAVKRLEEEKKRVQAIEEEKKAKASSKSPKNKNSKTNLLESPKVALASANNEVFQVEYTIFEGKYVEKKSSVKIQMRFNNPFPAFTETEKSIYPLVLTFSWDNIALVQKVEQLFTQYFTRPTPSKSRSDLFGPMSPVSTSNSLGTSLSPESAESPQPNNAKGNKDFLKYFCGFEISDGRKRLLTVEATSKDALRFLVGHVENYCNKEMLPVKIMYDFSCFYSHRLYEQLIGVSSKSVDKVDEKKGAGRRPSVQVVPTDDTKKGITRLRLQDTFENILSSKEIYIKNKKAEDLKILAALSKVYSIFSTDSVEQIIENGLLPDSCNLMNIKERFCDDTLIEVDNLLVFNQKKKKIEDEEMQRAKRETEHEEVYSSPETIDDLAIHLNEEVGFEGIPLIETPAHLPPAEKIIFEGEEKRKKARVRAFNTNPSGYSLEEVTQPEKKFWIYIPHLKGHIVAAFPPMTKELPPFNLHSYMTGTLIRSDRKHPPPKIRAYTNFSSAGTRSRKPEITISPDIVYCIMVNSWTQRASTQIDNKLDYKLRQSLKSPTTTKNHIYENFQNVYELSRQSANAKHRDEMEKSSKKYMTVPTYPEERKNLEKTLELRQTTPPAQPWINRGKTTSREDNRHPKHLDQARIDELNMIDLFDKNLSTMLRDSSASSSAASKRTGNSVNNFANPSTSVKLPKIK